MRDIRFRDVSGLSEQLDEVAEEGEWKDETLGPEEAHAKVDTSFSVAYVFCRNKRHLRVSTNML